MATASYSSIPSSRASSQLKPMILVDAHRGSNRGQYAEGYIDQINELRLEDERLKARIRRLRLISRILALLISIAVFIPITLTLHKFLTTKDIYRDVPQPDGTVISRTAWAKNSKTWPTYTYFAVAAVSVLLHFTIIISYWFSVQHANAAAMVTSVFSWVVLIGNLVVWSVAAGLYRGEKDKDGKSNDLWGWTCSAAAHQIQDIFQDQVNFNNFCNVQSVSWYFGIVQVFAALLTIFIFFLVMRRRETKKIVKRHTTLWESY